MSRRSPARDRVRNDNCHGAASPTRCYGRLWRYVTRRGPDLFIVGAPKCGTTSLYRTLRGHPQLYASPRKEPHFFCDVPPPHFRPMGPDAYFALFADAPVSSVAYEASTNYIYSAAACGSIRDYSPSSRILVALRDPADRAYSEYWHFRRYGLEPLSFEECVAADGEREVSRRYVERGLYACHLERYREAFGEDRVHVLLLDDLRRDAANAYAEVFRFLGVGADCHVDGAIRHGRGWAPRWPGAGAAYGRLVSDRSPVARVARKVMPRPVRRVSRGVVSALFTDARVPPMAPDTRALLCHAYAAEISRLESILGRDLTPWRT
ncbi:hypothetical protein CMK11_05855 [Candidatus Poribacteria bacterium]|nr:hypothetical protein [Candidatus Poribacteria bacterium]